MSASSSETPGIVRADGAPPRGAYPHAHRAGDLIFVSGTSSRRPDGTIAGAVVDAGGSLTTDIGEQTHAVIANIARTLEDAGASLRDLVQITTFLVDMSDFDGYNQAYAEYFDAATGPARTTVAVAALPHPQLAIEIQAIARLRSEGVPQSPVVERTRT